jgi:hypothetical protein
MPAVGRVVRPVRRRSDTVIAMTIPETLAVFVGIPVLIYGLIAVLVLVPGRAKRRARYRPGQDWEYPSQWWAGDQPILVPAAGATPGTTRGGARGTW